MPGKITAITMVKDEEDVILYTLQHLLYEEVDEIIVADNMSTDNTRAILDYIAAKDDRVIVIDDLEEGYYQSRKMTHLANMAAERGAEWIIPFDADEIWYCRDSKTFTYNTIGRILPKIEENVLVAPVWDHLPNKRDKLDMNPFVAIQFRERDPEILPVVAFRWAPGCVILQGNHGVHHPNGTSRGDVLEVRHFQYRSLEQFKNKLRQGKKAYDATDLPEGEGAHWRQWGALSDEQLEREFNALKSQTLLFDPAPVRTRDVTRPIVIGDYTD